MLKSITIVLPTLRAERPFRHSWLTMPDTPRTPAAKAQEARADALPGDVADRVAALEARIEEQDAALRRVLTLMVDWVEGGEHVARGAEAPVAPGGYVPIRGAAAAAAA